MKTKVMRRWQRRVRWREMSGNEGDRGREKTATVRKMELMRTCERRRWKREDEYKQREGGGGGGGRGKPFGIMYQVYTEHLRPAGSSLIIGIPLWEGGRGRRLLTKLHVTWKHGRHVSGKLQQEKTPAAVVYIRTLMIVWAFDNLSRKTQRILERSRLIWSNFHFDYVFHLSYCWEKCCWER